MPAEFVIEGFKVIEDGQASFLLGVENSVFGKTFLFERSKEALTDSASRLCPCDLLVIFCFEYTSNLLTADFTSSSHFLLKASLTALDYKQARHTKAAYETADTGAATDS